MEFFSSMLSSVATGIIGNLLTPYTRKLLHWRVVFEEDLPPDGDGAGEGTSGAEEAGDVPAKGQTFVSVLFVYAVTFLSLLFAFRVALNPKHLRGGELALSDTRLTPFFGGTIKEEGFWLIALLLTMACYVPCVLISQAAGHVVAASWYRGRVSRGNYSVIVFWAYIVVMLLLTGNWVYALYPHRTYLESLALPFIVFVIGVALFASGARSASKQPAA